MEHLPKLDIHFPPARESELHEEMKRRATAPWEEKPYDPSGKTPEGMPEGGRFRFHRNVVGNEPSCTVFIFREKPGHWVVTAIIPDKGQVNPIPAEEFKKILSSFDAEIADPAAKAVGGMSSIETSTYRLEDHFSPKAVRLLHHFCESSNQCDWGRHPSDQVKWIAFLICVFDDDSNVHCDIFGYCLKTANWWREDGVEGLVHEYDLALRVLKQFGRSREVGR